MVEGPQKQTMLCYYCDGVGKISTLGIDCLDCLGEKVLCIRCTHPPSQCDCAERQFDPLITKPF